MGTTIVISCPECKKQIKAPSELQGKRIKCKACGSIFEVRAASAKTNPAAKPAPTAKAASGLRPEPEPAKPTQPEHEEDDRNPYRLTTVDLTPRCPFCANEMESEEAVICIHCGYNTQTRSRVQSKVTIETTGADYFQWWLPAILSIVFIFVLIGFDVFYVFFFPAMVKDG